jgi:hypothetical protein
MTEEAAATYPLPLGQTVYGGTLNVTTGVLNITKAIADLGAWTWNYEASIPRFYAYGIQNTVKKPVNNVTPTGIVSDCFKSTTLEGSGETIYGGQGDNLIALSTGGVLSVKTTQYTDGAVFKTAMNGRKIAYINANAENEFLPLPDENIKADELHFGTGSLFHKNNEDILSVIIDRIAQYDVLIKLMSVYDINDFKKNNINYIFKTLGTYSNLWAYKNGMCHNKAPEWLSQMREYSKQFMGINANTDAVIQGNQYEYNYYLSDYVFPSSCEFIDELDLLQILKLLIENRFDPYI